MKIQQQSTFIFPWSLGLFEWRTTVPASTFPAVRCVEICVIICDLVGFRRRKRASLLLQNCSEGNKPALFFQTRQTRQTKTHILNGLAYFEILCCEKQCKRNSSFLGETKNGSHPFAEYQEDDNLGSFKFWIQHKVEKKSLKRNLCRSTQESYYKFRNTLPSLHTTSKESCCFKTKSGILLLEIFHSERHIHEKY